jgi:hypothetical protein
MRRDEATLPYAEIGPRSLGELMTSWADREKVGLLTAELPNANLARISLPGSPPIARTGGGMRAYSVEALYREAEIGTLEDVSLAIVWQSNGCLDDAVSGWAEFRWSQHSCMRRFRSSVRTNPRSEWAEPFRDALLRASLPN